MCVYDISYFPKFGQLYNKKYKKFYEKNLNFNFFPKNEPGLVLNLFLIFGKNPGSSSYKLGSY